MSATPAGQAPTPVVGALSPASEPSNLDIAVRVARQVLADQSDSSRDGFTYPGAYGATFEALRILLRAVEGGEHR